MAALVDDKKKVIVPATNNSAVAPVMPAAQTTATQPAVAQTTAAQKQTTNPYTGLPGLSESTQNILGGSYQASNDVTQAQDYLNSVVSGKPGDYSSNYKQQLDDLYNQVMNRQQFTYDLGSDMLYQQYKNQYQNLGKQAMMDTTAQAAALTGGYGNSYAATAGNQAYQSYLQQLNNIVPELYEKAYGRYVQEGNDLMNKYNLTSDLENADYAKYRDMVADWQNERDYANTDYWNKYNADYGSYMDRYNTALQLGGQENSQYNTNKNMAYNQAMAIIQTGKTPSSDLLNTAGISSSDAKKLVKYYKKKISSSGGGGGGSYGGSGSGDNSTADSGGNSIWYDSILSMYSKSGASNYEKRNAINKYVTNDKITQAEANKLYKELGLN